MRRSIPFKIFIFMLLTPTLWGAKPAPSDSTVPGIDPLPATASMTQDQLETYFTELKKGTPVTLTLDKGKTVNGLFSSYDDYYETIWLVPRKSEKGVFNQKGYKLTGIHNVKPWDIQKSSPTTFTPVSSSPSATKDDYYLLRQDGM